MMKVLLRVLRCIYTFLDSVFRPKHKVEKINIEINLEDNVIDYYVEHEEEENS